MASRLDFFDRIRKLHQTQGSLKEPRAKIRAQSITDDGDLFDKGDLSQFLDVLCREELRLIDQNTADAVPIHLEKFCLRRYQNIRCHFKACARPDVLLSK